MLSILSGRKVFSRCFLTFSIDKKKPLNFHNLFVRPLLLIFVILSVSVLCRRIQLPLLPGAHIYTHNKHNAHTCACSHTHIQYGQHTQAAAVHSPLLVLMNGPSLNYFVQISFRPLKKRSCLFIHFTFAPRLQYLRLCLQRIYPPPVQEERKKNCKRKGQKETERQGGREKKAIYTMYIK